MSDRTQDQAARVPVSPRRHRQAAQLETAKGKALGELAVLGFIDVSWASVRSIPAPTADGGPTGPEPAPPSPGWTQQAACSALTTEPPPETPDGPRKSPTDAEMMGVWGERSAPLPAPAQLLPQTPECE